MSDLIDWYDSDKPGGCTSGPLKLSDLPDVDLSWEEIVEKSHEGMYEDSSVPNPPESFRRFVLNRTEDETGISGTGVVAYGIQFPDGRCVIRWNTTIASTGEYDNILQVELIHGHKGKTKILWVD